MTTNDFIGGDIILADALVSLDDVELRKGFSRGWYRGAIQRATEELAIDSYWQKLTIDKAFPKTTLSMPIPGNIFNIQYIYLWNGACCTVSASQKVWWKRNFNNKGGNGSGYTADVKDIGGGTFDPFIPMYFPVFETIYYANIQEGKIMFSQSCSGYQNVRIICNGMGGMIGDEPTIPRFFRTAIIDYVRVEHFKAMMSREPRVYRIMYEEAERALNNPMNGSWKRARMRVSSMNSFEQKSMEEYYSTLNY